MRILVTGATGFLGSHVVKHLRRRYPHAKILRIGHRPASRTASCELDDVAEARAMLHRTKPTHILHLAGRVSQGSRDELWKANVDATYGLLEALATSPDLGKVRVVIAGSAGEYGAPPRRGALLESDPLEPVTVYGSIKREQYLLSRAYRHRGLQVVWARVFNVLGPGIPATLALGSFARQVALAERGRQKSIKVGNISAKRDYVDVRDVASALALLAVRGIPGEAYNVCSGRSWPMRMFLHRMIELTNKPIPIEAESSRFKPGDLRDVYGSYRKLAALGWRPRIGIEQSLQDTLQWHREHA